jgi:hypothetical protein
MTAYVVAHMYDQRLFNQDQGMSSGFGADDVYNVYEGALCRWSTLRALSLLVMHLVWIVMCSW